MEVKLNGQLYELPEHVTTIQELLDHLKLSNRIVIVEVNKEIVQKSDYGNHIRERDEIEMIHFVGGG
ncbi:sulfur carrier protein [Bacillus thermophilus]|uniref:Sulfur carrier protein n=1 Tax=Siminovitchia thermophila TaxID=1245522 RepID=A0ABS2R9A2_9BACI|nr:sulfur carrier protein ThiS [Siminovitchia thermophila]MBM7715734.1 sulfur carrier protein [Siminovitchia thermophila]ONK21294.1 thiamine biosynthesis protein ThiS [Bacillus sp. VT-16-64]